MGAFDFSAELPRRVLVTGAGGFIGSALVHRLTSLGAEITAVARRPCRLDPCAKAYRFVPCDLRVAEQIQAVVEVAQPQLVFHLAAQPDSAEGSQQTQAVIQHNVVGLSHLLDALMNVPEVSLIYGDSAKVYGNGAVPYRSDQALDSLSTYAVTKEAGWRLIDVYRRVHGLHAAGLRPTLVYGPGQSFNLFTYLINAVNSGCDEIALDGGAQTRDPLFIDDVVDAFVAAAAHMSRIDGISLPIGGDREMSVADITRLTVRLLGGRQKVQVRPTCVRPTETLRSWCDNAEAKALLKWSPRVSFEEGMLRTAGLSEPAAEASMQVSQRESV